jgi:hypothetical protein
MVATAVPVAMAVTQVSAVTRVSVEAAPLRAVWVLMEPPVTVVTRATAVSAVTVLMVFPALLPVIAELMAAMPETAATVELLVKPVLERAVLTVRAETAETPVQRVMVVRELRVLWAPTELPLAIQVPRAVTVATVAQVALAVRAAQVSPLAWTPSVVMVVTPVTVASAVVV